MSTLPLRGPHITLAQALKVAGFIGSGGQAKHLIREGKARVNGEVETRPGRKLVKGDRFQFEENPEWQVSATPEET
jgi:ribosome-associated protein